LLDLLRWFTGEFVEASGMISTAFWPMAPAEDNAFVLLRSKEGAVAEMHASWAEWKNTFRFEVFGERGYLRVNGLGASYGPETLCLGVRENFGKVPREETFIFDGPDESLARDTGSNNIVIWGDGTATRSFMYIDDCVKGIDMIAHCEDLIAKPINLGSSELVSINELVDIVEAIAGIKLRREYDPTAPRGVAGRNSDNTLIQSILHWEPRTSLREGMAKTYAWIAQQYTDRIAGKRIVS
jgi:dTDP-D-glucose 4,6-dehydratase